MCGQCERGKETRVYKAPVAKAKRPSILTTAGFDSYAARLSVQLIRATKAGDKAAIARMTSLLKQEWTKATPDRRERMINSAVRAMAVNRASATYVASKVATSMKQLIVESKKAIAAKHGLAVGATFDAVDKRVVDNVRSSAAFYIRDEFGNRQTVLSNKARNIVAAGVERGLDDKTISKTLARELASSAIHRSENYYRVVSSIFSARARDYGMLRSYDEAGIEAAKFEAVGDERTCDICYFYDGKICDVKERLGTYAKVAASPDPEEVVQSMPFLGLGRDSKGNTAIYYKQPDGSRQMVARVDQSAAGTKDGQGQYTQRLSDSKLAAAGIGTPPIHPQCLPGDALVTPAGAVTATTERWYEGELVVIRTAAGNHLRCTPNHPILTSNGWLAAHLINEGCHVVGSRVGEWVAGSDNHHEQVPTSIEEVARAFGHALEVVATEVPVSAEDFHGDGASSQVAVVRANRNLLPGFEPALGEHRLQDDLVVRDVRSSTLLGCSARDQKIDRTAMAERRCVSSRNLVSPLVVGHSRPLEQLGFRTASQSDSGSSETPVDGLTSDPVPSREAIRRFAGEVALDEVVEVGRVPFGGHVFNLQTAEGWYVANGIITHNCRCTTTPVFDAGGGARRGGGGSGSPVEPPPVEPPPEPPKPAPPPAPKPFVPTPPKPAPAAAFVPPVPPATPFTPKPEMTGQKGLVAGKQYGKLVARSTRDKEYAALLKSVDPVTAKAIEKIAGLDKITFAEKAGARCNGYYQPKTKSVRIATQDRRQSPAGKIGQTWSLSNLGKSQFDKVSRTLTHELAHSVHMTDELSKSRHPVIASRFPSPLNGQLHEVVSKAWLEKQRQIVLWDHAAVRAAQTGAAQPAMPTASQYAMKDHHEYFAESWTAYMHGGRAELKVIDPVGHGMVEKAIALVSKL